MNTIFPKWLSWSLGLLLIIVLSLIALDKSYALKQRIENRNPQNTLAVTAEGKVKAVPDLAIVDVGVVTNSPTAAEAQSQSSQKTNAIIEFVKKEGVVQDDITTSQFTIAPQQDYSQGKGTITGYQANQSITIKIHGVDKSNSQLTTVISGLTAAGANQVNGVSLSFDDPDNLRGQARELAIVKARTKAQDLAKAAGITIGRVVNVSEATDYSGTPQPMAADGLGGAGDGKSDSTNVQLGQQDVIADMTVSFEVK